MKEKLIKYGFLEDSINKKISGEKLIPVEVGCWFLERHIIKYYLGQVKEIQTRIFDFDKYSYYLTWKDDVVLDYYFETKDINVVKKYFKNKNDYKLIDKILFELYRIPFFNKLIGRCCNDINPFYINNLDLLSSLFLSSSFLSCNNKILFNKEKEMSLEQVLLLTELYFDELDKSGELKKSLFELIDSNKILLWDRSSDFEKIRIQKEYNISDNSIKVAHFSLNNGLINIPLNGTLYDVFLLVHEFFHYYSTIGCNFYNSNLFLREFVEFPSIFFETNLISFLNKQGFSEEEIFACYNYRNKNHLELYSLNSDLVNFIRKFVNNEEIDLNDFFKDYTYMIELLKKIAPESHVLAYAIERQNLGIEGNKRDCDELIISIMLNLHVIPLSYDYMFAKFLTDYSKIEDEQYVSFMLNLTKGMACINMDSYDILSLILPAFYLMLFKLPNKEHGIKRIPVLKKKSIIK